MTDTLFCADREDVHLGEEFAVRIAPRELRRDEREGDGGASYVVVLDDSGSMDVLVTSTRDEFGSPSRKEMAVSGIRHLLSEIPSSSPVEIITFAVGAAVRAAGTAGQLRDQDWSGNPDAERSWTNLEDALRLAYARADQFSTISRRVVVVSDGLPNRGLRDVGELAALAEDAADRAVHTDAVGIGAGADFELLSRLAVTGVTEHVAARATAQQAMAGIVAELTALSRDVVAPTGELTVTVSPHFRVEAVYQVDPVRRRIPDALVPGGAGSPSTIRLRLGAVGADDVGQPHFILRLRAPRRVSDGPLPVLKLAGSIGIGASAVPLAPQTIHLRVVDDPQSPILVRALMEDVLSLELDAEISARIGEAPMSAHEAIWRDGAERARQINNFVLADAWERACSGLHEGLAPKDVANEARATSSRSTTRSKRDWWNRTRTITPEQVRAARPRRPNLDEDPYHDEEMPAAGGRRSSARSYDAYDRPSRAAGSSDVPAYDAPGATSDVGVRWEDRDPYDESARTRPQPWRP